MPQPDNSALSDNYDDLEDDLEAPPAVAPKETLTQPEDVKRELANIPPALVEDVQDNPEILRPVARSMAAINLHNLFVRMQHPATNNSDRMAFQTLVNKMGGLDGKDTGTAAGAGFSITINIPNIGASQGQVIEAKATRVPDTEAIEGGE